MKPQDSPEQRGVFNEDLMSTEWLGYIVDNNDPLFLGRCKIQIFEKFDKLPIEAIPWAYPVKSGIFAGNDGYGSFSFPKLDSLVRVRFQNGDFYSPEYYAVENINKSMQSEISSSYTNAQVLVFDEDEDLKIVYTQSKGLYIWLKSSFFNITPGGADIIEKSPHHYINSPDVQVGTDASHPDTKCDKLINLLSSMATAIDAKYGAPSTCSAMVQSSSSDVCSSIVKIA